MDTRFRVRFRGGGDATVGSLEAFHELVQSGEITADDLVYDALTGEWIPAQSHPVYRLCTDPLAGLGGEATDADADEESGELTFELAEPAQQPTAEEAESAFVRQMDEERAADPESPPAMVDLSGLGEPADMLPPDSPVAAPWEPAEVLVTEPYIPSWGKKSKAAEPTPIHRAQQARARVPYASPARQHRRLHVSLTVVLVLGSAGLAGGVGLAWPDLIASGVADVPVAAVGSRVVTSTEEDLRGAAFIGFLEEVERLGESFGIGPAPEAWLEGRYLADAAAFPSVGAYWVRYRDYVEVTRNQEDDLYRAAYLAGLEGIGVSGPVRSLRLATAVADFSAAGAAREAVYTRVAALADAAIELHQLSTSSQGRISYEPARGNRVSADPVIEATGRDADMQQALDAALDRVLSALHGDMASPGPGREGVEHWLFEALKRGSGE